MKKLDDIIKKYDLIVNFASNTYEFNPNGIPTAGSAISLKENDNTISIARTVILDSEGISYTGWRQLESPYEYQVESLYQQFLKCCRLYKQKIIMNKLDDISQDFKDEN